MDKKEKEKKDLQSILRNREKKCQLSATIQESAFDEEVIPVNEECDSHFNTESLPQQANTQILQSHLKMK